MGARYLSNDLSILCGNMLNSSVGKTIILWCIMFQATGEDVLVASVSCLFFLLVQFQLSNTESCDTYLDMTPESSVKANRNVRNSFWLDPSIVPQENEAEFNPIVNR